jgi:hypothetical protein
MMCALAALAGCSSLQDSLIATKPPPTTSVTIEKRVQQADDAEKIYRELKTARPPASVADLTAARNDAIAAKLLALDQSFETVVWSAWIADTSVATLSDWAVLGLTAAGSLATGGATQALSATAAGITGAKTSLQKNALYSKTVDQLIFAMTVNRAKQESHIRTCMQLPDTLYGLSMANVDLERYKQAAILPITVATVTANAANATAEDPCARLLANLSPEASMQDRAPRSGSGHTALGGSPHVAPPSFTVAQLDLVRKTLGQETDLGQPRLSPLTNAAVTEFARLNNLGVVSGLTKPVFNSIAVKARQTVRAQLDLTSAEQTMFATPESREIFQVFCSLGLSKELDTAVQTGTIQKPELVSAMRDAVFAFQLGAQSATHPPPITGQVDSRTRTLLADRFPSCWRH